MDIGADRRPQHVLPGGERLTDAELAQRRANAPLRPKAKQNLVMDEGLFGDSHLQDDLFKS
jgi:hypothetical protein